MGLKVGPAAAVGMPAQAGVNHEDGRGAVETLRQFLGQVVDGFGLGVVVQLFGLASGTQRMVEGGGAKLLPSGGPCGAGAAAYVAMRLEKWLLHDGACLVRVPSTTRVAVRARVPPMRAGYHGSVADAWEAQAGRHAVAS